MTINITTSTASKTSALATLWDCFACATNRLTASEYSSPAFEEYLHTGGVSYGAEWRNSFPLITAKGNEARKYLNMVVNRNNEGTYECYVYIL